MKLLKVLVAVLVMAAMAVPVIAEDRLQLSGEMRTRAFTTDTDLGDADNVSDTWANQRLRIAGKIAVAEGVSVTFRTDITEGTNWGDSSDFKNGLDNSIGPIRTNGYGHGRSGAQQQWDRAHLDITKGMFHLRAGQQYVGTGGAFAVDTQDSGLSLDIKTVVPVNVFFIVDKDNNVFNDTTEEFEDGSDAFLYGASVSPKGDNFSSKIFAAGYNDNSVTDVYVVGVNGSTNLGVVKLFGEFDYFTGDHNSDLDDDAFGTQLMLDASMAATDAITVGGQFFYANGDDTDTQYVLLGNGFNGFDPIFDVGTSLSNEEIVFGLGAQGPIEGGRPFDFTGENAGVIGGRLYSNFKVSDSLNLGASAAYLTVEEDAIVDVSTWAFAGGMVYTILPNATFQLQLQYTDGEVDSVDGVNVSNGDYDQFAAGTGLFVTF